MITDDLMEGLTFDDVLLVPGRSDVLPAETEREAVLTNAPRDARAARSTLALRPDARFATLAFSPNFIRSIFHPRRPDRRASVRVFGREFFNPT